MPSGSKRRAKNKAAGGSKPAAAADLKASSEPPVDVPSVKAVPESAVARGAENATQVAAQPPIQATPASDGPAKAPAGVGGGGAGAVPLKGIENRAAPTGSRTAEEGVKSVLKSAQGEKAGGGKGKSKAKKASFAAGTPDPTPSERHRRGHLQESGLGSGAMSPISVGSRDGSSSYPPSPSSFSSLDAMLEEAADLWASHSHSGPAAHNDDSVDTDTGPYRDDVAHDDTYCATDPVPLRGSAEGNIEAESAYDSFWAWDSLSLLPGISSSQSERPPPLEPNPAVHATNSAASSVAAVPLAPQATAATSATDTIKQLEASAAQAASSAAANTSKQAQATPAPAPAAAAASAAVAAPSESPQPESAPPSGVEAVAAQGPVSQPEATPSQAGGSSKSSAITEASAENGSLQVTPSAEVTLQPVPAAAAPPAAEAPVAGGEGELSEADKMKAATQEEPEAMTCTGTVYWLFGFGKK